MCGRFCIAASPGEIMEQYGVVVPLSKIPFYFSSASFPLLSFGGIINSSASGDQVLILTTKAIPPYNDIHDWMPVIFDPMHEQDYLNEGDVSGIWKSLDYYEVSSLVNRVNVDSPDLIVPVTHKYGQIPFGDG